MLSDSVEEIHIRLRDELERQGLSLADASRAIGEATSQGLRDVCSGRKRATAELVARLVVTGIDVLYVLTGRRADSNGATSHHLPAQASAAIDLERLSRIVEMLEAAARLAGRKWQVKKLVAVAAEVYNVLADEPALDEPKVERILKLVVNR